ncbi:MAG TPA: hypothetical protein ENI88_04235 [Desulfobulbus sp.]|nr:hypothetical protein [Desulfobulbus sp.]
MDAATLIPTPDQIPVGWGWFQVLLTLTFYLHVLAMDTMLGLVIIAFIHHFSSENKSLPVTREISKKLPYAIALAVNLGIAPLLFVQVLYGHFIYVSSVLMGVFWLSIVLLLIVAYYSAYIYSYRYQSMRAGRMVTSGITMFSLLSIAFFLSNNMTLMLHPESWVRYFEHSDGFLLNLGDPTIIPRYLHFVTSAVAVGGLGISLFYTYRSSRGHEGCTRWIRYGCNWFAGATIVNFALGFWFLGALPEGLIKPVTLVGGLFSLFLIMALITAILAVIAAMRYRPLPAAGLLLATLFFMVLVREFLRVSYLKPWFSPVELTVQPGGWSPFLLFLLSFIAGLILIGWMLKTTLAAAHKKEARS